MAIPVEQINGKELRGMVKLLNDSDLISGESPVTEKITGKSKADMLEGFADALEKINEAGKLDDAPAECVTFFNKVFGEEAEPEGEAEAGEDSGEATGTEDKGEAEAKATPKKAAPKKTTPKKTEPKKTSTASRAKGSGEIRREYLAELITQGKFTRAEIMEKAKAKFPEIAEATIKVDLTDGKNPKYNKFPKLIKESKDKILSFE